MTAMPNDEFARRAMELAGPTESFQPSADYDPDGDCVEFVFQPDPFRAERVDDLVTVYYSQETGDVIGSLIKDVSGFCRRVLETHPGFRIVIDDGRVKLEHIFVAQLMTKQDIAPDDLASVTYRKLIDAAEQSDLEVDLTVA